MEGERGCRGEVNLQAFFAEPILEQTALSPAYSDHTNDVWRVRTRSEDVIVRVPRADRLVTPFWWGCHELFGCDPAHPARLLPVNRLLARLSPVPVPRILRPGLIEGREAIVVDRLAGTRLTDLNALPGSTLIDLGRMLATIHRHEFPWWGNLAVGLRAPLSTFHERLVQTLHGLVARFYSADADPAIAEALPEMVALAQRLPAPTAAALVMLDVDATQFLSDGARLTGLTDTEAYVVAPRTLDFVGYEYELNAAGAQALARGYSTMLPLPDLSAVRPVYRYFYRLLGVQGQVPFAEWMNHPAHFDR